jgi:GntR family transcriptional regulator/MocR family aminotransferase
LSSAPELTVLKAKLHAVTSDGSPLHVRLHRLMRTLITDGALTQGDRLPSSRALSASLAVSRDTVETAYAQMEAEGYLVRRLGSGSFVSSKTELLRAPSSRGNSRGSDLSLASAISRRGRALVQGGGVRDQLDVRTFVAGVPETRTFPITVWQRLQRQVLKDTGSSILQHGDPMGSQALRHVIAQYLNQERGATASAEQIMILTSSQQALSLCAQVLLDAGDKVFMEDPCYHGARKAFAAAGVETWPIPVDAEGLDINQLLAQPGAARVVYLTPSHQYPTGATLSLDRRLAILGWARTGRWVIEDDYDSEFHYAGRPTACMQGLDNHERTLYIGTFSKSLFPSLRLAYMVLPRELVQPMMVARTLLDGHTTRINQLTLARFIESGHFGAHVRSMRKVYSGRLEVMIASVQRYLKGVATAHIPQGGLQLPCLLDPGVDELDSIQRGARFGLDLPSLSRFYHSPPSRGGWLMGFAAFTPEEISQSVRRLSQVFRERRP